MRTLLCEIVNADPNLEVIAMAEDGMDAVKIVTDNPPDLLLLDLEMPRWDGLNFLRHYRSKIDAKVVVLSGVVGGKKAPIGAAALRYGADAVVEKRVGDGDGGTDGSAKNEIIETIYKLLEIS